MDEILVADNIVKRFGSFEAVKGISISIKKGEIFGFLGPNGAGKTTTMRMCAALSPVSGGTINGKDISSMTSRKGDDRYTVWQSYSEKDIRTSTWKNEIPIEAISKLLGHDSNAVTLRYIGVNIGDMTKAIADLTFD